jgi:hypothetical protein
VKLALMAFVGVLLGYARRRLNQLAVRTWQSSGLTFESLNARLVSLVTLGVATALSLLVAWLLGAPGWSVFMAAALFVLIGETKNFSAPGA